MFTLSTTTPKGETTTTTFPYCYSSELGRYTLQAHLDAVWNVYAYPEVISTQESLELSERLCDALMDGLEFNIAQGTHSVELHHKGLKCRIEVTEKDCN